jgi:hypothetical protein
VIQHLFHHNRQLIPRAAQRHHFELLLARARRSLSLAQSVELAFLDHYRIIRCLQDRLVVSMRQNLSLVLCRPTALRFRSFSARSAATTNNLITSTPNHFLQRRVLLVALVVLLLRREKSLAAVVAKPRSQAAEKVRPSNHRDEPHNILQTLDSHRPIEMTYQSWRMGSPTFSTVASLFLSRAQRKN